MKQFRLLSLFFLLCIAIQLFAEEPKHEFRATWLATVSSIDWPNKDTKAKDDASRLKQQQELTTILDKLQAGNMNACYLQVRSLCDAMYKSSYEPWSAALTGTRGKDPGYDPLAFAIEEAHKRGLELHIWVNPFRATSSGTLSSNDQLLQHAGEWIIKYDNGSFSGQIIDPGYPQARAYVIKVLMEIVNNYDVDGILMDDYFYPYGGTTTEDAKSKSLYKPANVVDVNKDGDTDDDWRRANVDTCMKLLYDTLQAVKPWVRFGMGPFGIWSTQKKAADAYGLTLPSGIVGLDDYDVQACNTVEWVKKGWVDYINPQLYWSRDYAGQDYDVLCKWWAKDVCEHFSNQLPDGKKVHFCVSQAAYHAYDGYKGYDDGVGEIQDQIDVNRANLSSGYNGSVFYNTTAYCKMYQELQASHFNHKALMPAMDWKVTEQLSAPTNLRIENNTLLWEHAAAERFTVYAYPKSLDWATAQQTGTYLQDIVYGTEYALSHIPNWQTLTLAVCSYDRYGVEHGVAIINEGQFPDSDPNATEITWVLNGGEIKVPILTTNEELWEIFKADFDEFYAAIYPNYQIQEYPINAVLELTWPKWSGENFATEFMTQHPDWQWLAEYIQSIYGEITETKIWRFNLYAFFNATNQVCYQNGQVISWASCADFTEAGKPEAWNPYYGNSDTTDMQLPTQVTETYILPTPTHPSGAAFLGWYTTADFSGNAVTAIPACWVGTLYAKWDGTHTAIEQVTTDNTMRIYDIMGRMVGTDIHTVGKGVFIIEQNGQRIKTIR